VDGIDVAHSSASSSVSHTPLCALLRISVQVLKEFEASQQAAEKLAAAQETPRSVGIDIFDRFRSIMCVRSGSKVLHDCVMHLSPYHHRHDFHHNNSKPAEGKGSAVEVGHTAFKL
jgi:hypothetical protein